MTDQNLPPLSFDQKAFLSNFQGMEDLAEQTICSFLTTLPQLVFAVESAIQNQNPKELELSAHTLKGVLSNFFAEPSRLLAWKLEKMGHDQLIQDASQVLLELSPELTRLFEDLKFFMNGRKLECPKK